MKFASLTFLCHQSLHYVLFITSHRVVKAYSEIISVDKYTICFVSWGKKWAKCWRNVPNRGKYENVYLVEEKGWILNSFLNYTNVSMKILDETQ